MTSRGYLASLRRLPQKPDDGVLAVIQGLTALDLALAYRILKKRS